MHLRICTLHRMQNRSHCHLVIRAFSLMALVAGLLAPKLLTHAYSSNSNSNLVANGGFEDGNTHPDGWNFCGGAKLADTQNGATDQMVHGGRYALRMGQPIDNTCGSAVLGPNQVAFQDVTIPSDASDVTISFWYQALGTWPAGEWHLELTNEPRDYLGSVVFIDTIKMDELTPGWHLYRQNLKSEDVAKVRGKTLYLQLYVRFKGQPDWDWQVYVDDVKVTPIRERTQTAPLPADLQGNGTRPIVVNGPNNSVYRIDTDGDNRIKLPSTTLPPYLPTWSPDGKRIVFQTDWLQPEASTDTTKFPALVGRAWLMNADGSGLRPIFQTLGQEGRKEVPLGCLRFSPNTCSDTGLDALDGLLTNLHWSPDSQKISATICFRNRWYNSDKSSQDATCHVGIHDVPTGVDIVKIGPTVSITDAAGASWSPNGKILFETGPSLTQRAKGIWELDTTTQPPQAVRLLTWLTGYASSSIDLRSNPESDPTWSPDGRYFITYRQAASVHYVPVTGTDPLFLSLRSNYHIMVHDRQNLGKPRMLLLTDHGRLSGRPAWSPNGKYVLYTLSNDEGTAADIWWLNVQTSETGKLTNDGASYNADWLPTAQLPTEPTPAPTSTPNPNLVFKAFMPMVVRDVGGTQPGPTATPSSQTNVTPVVLPTLTPTTASTPLPAPVNPTAVPPRGISGKVLYKGVGIAGITVRLEVCVPSLPCEAKVSTQTDANGNYNFPYAPSQSGFFSYQVTYTNGPDGGNASDSRFLSYWQVSKSALISYSYAERLAGGTFDIADVELIAPANGTELPVPVTFSWKSRDIAGEKYQGLLDTQNNGLNQCSQDDPGTVLSFTVSTLACQFPAMVPGVPHRWFVLVFQGGESGGEGASRVRAISFAP